MRTEELKEKENVNVNDKNLKFTVRPTFWFLPGGVLLLLLTVFTLPLDADTWYVTLISLSMALNWLLTYINVRIYAYKYHFIKRNILRQSREYSWQDVELRYIGDVTGGITRYDIVDSDGKKVFMTLEDTFSNTDALKKAVLRKKASSKGVPQHRRFWE